MSMPVTQHEPQNIKRMPQEQSVRDAVRLAAVHARIISPTREELERAAGAILAQLALPLVMVVREPGPQGDVMPWAVARQLSPISAPPPIIPAFRWREVYGMSPRGAPRTLLFAATTFTLVSHGDAASARSALRDPDAIIVQIEPVDPNTRVQATEQNVVGIARAMWTEVQRALLLMPDGLHVAVAFAGPAPLAATIV